VANGRQQELRAIVGTSAPMLALLGAIAMVQLLLFASVLTKRVLEIPDFLRGEAGWAFRILALALPAVVMSGALRGILEAQQRFGALARLRVPFAVMTYLSPLIVLQFTLDLRYIMTALVLIWLTYVG